MYVDYEYYAKQYGGTIPEEKFPLAMRKAEAYIRQATYIAGDSFATENNMVKDEVCAVADVYYSYDVKKEKSKIGTIKSENNDGYSVSYVTEQTDGQTEEELLRKKAYDAAYMYLLPTGWLSRKVGYCGDYECAYNSL